MTIDGPLSERTPPSASSSSMSQTSLLAAGRRKSRSRISLHMARAALSIRLYYASSEAWSRNLRGLKRPRAETPGADVTGCCAESPASGTSADGGRDVQRAPHRPQYAGQAPRGRLARKISVDEVRHYKHFYAISCVIANARSRVARPCCRHSGRVSPRSMSRMPSTPSNTSTSRATRRRVPQMRLRSVPHRRPPAREEALPARHGDKDAVEAAPPQRRGWARGRADDDVSGGSSRSVAEIECGQIESTCERAS